MTASKNPLAPFHSIIVIVLLIAGGPFIGIGVSESSKAWQPVYIEYIHLPDGSVMVTMPLHDLCIAGGGTIDDATDQRILSYMDAAQLRLLQMEQEAQALKESAP